MAEPAAKKARTEDADETAEAAKEAAPVEQEVDAKDDKAPKIKQAPVFHIEDTTMNVMQSSIGNILLPLTDGGLQYLLAGARANVGVKSGRYLFEVKVVEVMNPAEDPQVRQKLSGARCHARVGFSTEKSSLFLGETDQSVCFDSEGGFIHDSNRTVCSQKFSTESVVSVLLNLEKGSPNENTVSLFRDGQRVAQPQPLPEGLRGKTLFPSVTFRNMTIHYNFGEQLAPLPFKCRPIGEASQKDATVVAVPPAPKDGRREVLFPVSLPDEGTFDWLDMFLEKNPGYTELSSRAILNWAEKSGIHRPRGYGSRSCNDKPEMGFGIATMDDGSIRRVLQTVAPLQQRNYVVMEVKSNLIEDERKELLNKWPASRFKRTAQVLMGKPPADFTKRGLERMLQQKQAAADAAFKLQVEKKKREKEQEKLKKQLQKERALAMKKAKKAAAETKRKLEIAKKKKEAEAKGEEFNEDEVPPVEDEPEEEEEEAEVDDPMEEEPPAVELSEEEKHLIFRKNPIPDLSPFTLNTMFSKFSIPEKDEGFDVLNFDWLKAEKCKEHVKEWVAHKKTTTRVEDLVPGDWFAARWKDWQKTLSNWHSVNTMYKAALLKNGAARKAYQEKKKAKEEKAAKAEAAGEEEKKEESEEEPEDMEADRVDFDELDAFDVDDVLDVGAGEPLFSHFGFEDWSLLGLRFELHLLVHAFRKDVEDQERAGITLEHLPFYYQKYIKKPLNFKFFGVEGSKELVALVKETIKMKGHVLASNLPDDLESFNIFVMISEEARRDRECRLAMGDESAKVKIHNPAVAAAQAQAAAAAAAAGGSSATITAPSVRPASAASMRPLAANTAAAPKPAGMVKTATPAWTAAAGARPAAPVIRPAFGGGWRPGGPAWRG